MGTALLGPRPSQIGDYGGHLEEENDKILSSLTANDPHTPLLQRFWWVSQLSLWSNFIFSFFFNFNYTHVKWGKPWQLLMPPQVLWWMARGVGVVLGRNRFRSVQGIGLGFKKKKTTASMSQIQSNNIVLETNIFGFDTLWEKETSTDLLLTWSQCCVPPTI